MDWLALLKKKKQGDNYPTKPTKPSESHEKGSFVGFVGSPPPHFQEITPEPDSYCWPHSPAWNGQEIALFTQRMQHLQRHGLGEPEAEATAQNLLHRDRQQDDRHLCLECRNCTSNRCKLGRPVLTVLQHCDRFNEAVKQ